MELSKKSGSIAYCLAQNKDLLWASYADKSISLIAYKNQIKTLVLGINNKEESQKSTATKRFLFCLENTKNKDQVVMLVENTICAGDDNRVVKIK